MKKTMENVWRKQQKMYEKINKKCVKKTAKNAWKGGAEWVQILMNFMGKLTEISHILSMKNVWKKQQKMHEKKQWKMHEKIQQKMHEKTMNNAWKGVLNGCRFYWISWGKSTEISHVL